MIPPPPRMGSVLPRKRRRDVQPGRRQINGTRTAANDKFVDQPVASSVEAGATAATAEEAEKTVF